MKLCRAESRASQSSEAEQGKSFLPFLWTELSRGYALANDEARYAEKRRKVYAFVKVWTVSRRLITGLIVD